MSVPAVTNRPEGEPDEWVRCPRGAVRPQRNTAGWPLVGYVGARSVGMMCEELNPQAARWKRNGQSHSEYA